MISYTDNLSRLLVIMAQLRDPDIGCPWDKKQTFASIVPHTLEEAYEVADAIERSDYNHLKDELGDLLFQVVFYAQLAYEQNLFDFNGIARSICDKLIRRHPHVFGEVYFDSDDELRAAWEEAKARERSAKDNSMHANSLLDGVPKALPELTRAYKLQNRAAAVGFDWPEPFGIFHKIEEELDEVKRVMEDGEDRERLKEEVGDVLFAMVNLARHLGVYPEQALREGNKKFDKRFRKVEQRLADEGRQPQECSLEELDAIWDEVKAQD